MKWFTIIKVKPKKAKLVYLTSQTFSKRYSELYNNSKYADFTIKFDNGESLHAHKVVLHSNSEFFEKHEGNTFTFPKEDDEKAAKSLIKFYYDGSFDYSDESSVIIFTLLAAKYKTKHLSELKLPAKLLLNGIIAYIEKDLTNRVSQFDTLAESVDFKKMEKEDLTKMYAKKKWLQKSSTFLNQIIMKDLQDSEGSGSDKDSDKSSEEEEEEEEEEDGGSSGKVVELDLKASYNAFANSYDKKTKLYSATTSGWYSGIGKKVADKFAVEFGNNCSPVMVGYISKDKYNQNAANYNSGFCYYVSSNYLYGSNMISGSSYSGASYNSGSVLGVEFFRKKKE